MAESEEEFLVQNGTVDYCNRPANKKYTGGWAIVPIIYGSELCERLAALGILFNLVVYLSEEMGLQKDYSVKLVTNALGATFMLTLIGGFIADEWLGRYSTICFGGALELLGLILLTLQSTVSIFRNLSFLYVAISFLSFGNGCIKSSVSSFGADQFDQTDAWEKKQSSHMFNWFFFSITIGSTLAVTVLPWVQLTYGFGWGIGATAVAMLFGSVAFVTGRKRYRYCLPTGSPITAVICVFKEAIKNSSLPLPADPCQLNEVPEQEHKFQGYHKLPHTKRLRFFDRAAIVPIPDEGNATSGSSGHQNAGEVPTVTHVEEIKLLICLLPILATTFIFWTIYAQLTTLSVLQGQVMERTVGALHVPSASMGFFLYSSILTTLFMYDRYAMPFLSRVTGNDEGLTPLQRIGIGLLLGILCMVVAALVETRRLEHLHRNVNAITGKMEYINDHDKVFWLIPQYVLLGIGEAMTYTGQLEFFYNESPPRLRTLGTSFCLCTLSIGFFASSALVSTTQNYTKSKYRNGWLADDINNGHVDYYYWVLAMLSAVNFLLYIWVARWFKYRSKTLDSQPVALEFYRKSHDTTEGETPDNSHQFTVTVVQENTNFSERSKW